MDRVTVPGPNIEGLPISAAVKIGEIVYVSGQVGIKPDEKKPEEDITKQTRWALTNLSKVLQDAGSSLEKVDKVLVYLVKQQDFEVMNRVYGEFFKKEFPARTTVVVESLANPELLVEIECYAHL